MNKRDFIIFYRSKKVHLETQIAAIKNDFTPQVQKLSLELKKKLVEVNEILSGKKSGLVS